jgi:hypothetical protein
MKYNCVGLLINVIRELQKEKMLEDVRELHSGGSESPRGICSI